MISCQARLTPTGHWKTATEVSRDERVVLVIVKGKFHSLPPEQVREKPRKVRR